MDMETVKWADGALCVLHKYLRTKSCDSKYYEYLEPSEPFVGALAGMDMEVRRGHHVAFSTRQKIRDFFFKLCVTIELLNE